MTRVLHISDLHFGRTHPPAIAAFEQFLGRMDNSGDDPSKKRPDLILVTGDWTQRARRAEFAAAAAFIERLEIPLLSVPGNHDIPLYDVLTRLFAPLGRYRRTIAARTQDTYRDGGLVIVGITTPHPARSVEGRIRGSDLRRARELFTAADPRALRAIACHHPLLDPMGGTDLEPAARVQEILDLRPQLILSGHYHQGSMEMVTLPDGHQILHIAAGSTVSTRLRGEANGFHVMDFDGRALKVATYELGEEGFIVKHNSSRDFSFA